MAKSLNERGVEWCEEHFNAIVSALKTRLGRSNLSLLRVAVMVAVTEPMLAVKVAWFKCRWPLVSIREIAAVATVDYAIKRAKRGQIL